jgi:hypothetical protein
MRRDPASAPVDQRSTLPPAWRGDVLWVTAGVLLIAALCLGLTRGRIFWEDEVLGWTLLRDPSWRHMLHEWSLGADGGGGLFYVSARLWLSLFGASTLSFRLYSAAGFAAAFTVLWVTLRPYYSRQALAVAIGGIWFLGPGLIAHICEGRFYGLFLFGALLSFYVVLRFAADSRQRSLPWLFLSFVANAVLVSSHFFGLVYSAILLASLVIIDVARKHPRWRLYLPCVLAWLLLLPQRGAIGSAINVNSPHTWITRPGLHKLFGAYHAFDTQTKRLLLLIAIAVIVTGWRSRHALMRHVRTRFKAHPELYLVTLAIATVPVLFFLESWLGTPIFVDRYLMPVILVPIVLVAEALGLLRRAFALQSARGLRVFAMPAVRSAGCFTFLTLLALWVVIHGPRSVSQRFDYTGALVRQLPKGSTVVLPDSLVYTEVIARQANSPVHFVYLLDWERSISPRAPRADVSSFHLLSSWRHAAYHAETIQDQSVFVRSHPEFFVVETRLEGEDADPNATDTVLNAIAKLPGETVHAYPALVLNGVEDKVWLVCRLSCSASSSAQAYLPQGPRQGV